MNAKNTDEEEHAAWEKFERLTQPAIDTAVEEFERLAAAAPNPYQEQLDRLCEQRAYHQVERDISALDAAGFIAPLSGPERVNLAERLEARAVADVNELVNRAEPMGKEERDALRRRLLTEEWREPRPS